MKTWLEERIVPEEDILYCHDYYSEPGVRETAHGIKNGDLSAIKKAARDMAEFVSSSDILVPIPSRTGKATTTLLLAKEISKIRGSKVSDILTGHNRQALYDLKLTGARVTDDFFGYRSVRRPRKGNIVLIDNVYATGATANAAANDFPYAKVLVYAKDSTASPSYKIAEDKKVKTWREASDVYRTRLKNRFTEDKARFIDRLDITDEQKEELKVFFKKHPNFEGKIDWNRKDLSYDDFKELLATEGNTKSSQRKYGLSGQAQIEDLVIGKDYEIVYKVPEEGLVVYYPLNFKASEVLAKPSTPPEGVTGKWCICGRNYSPGTRDQHWKDYTRRGIDFFFWFIENEYIKTKYAVARYPDKQIGFEMFNCNDDSVDDLRGIDYEDVMSICDKYPYLLQDVIERDKRERRLKTQKGPAGGWIFYDKGSYSDGWRYLECAPQDIGFLSAGWWRETEWTEPKYINGTNRYKKDNCTHTYIGDGLRNTELQVQAKEGGHAFGLGHIKLDTYAAKACKNYKFGGFNDWFLPSKQELEAMKSNLYDIDLGNFADGTNIYYWSSSEYTGGDIDDFPERYTWALNFDNDECIGRTSGLRAQVRPIRRF